jgi:hypothetical protein
VTCRHRSHRDTVKWPTLARRFDFRSLSEAPIDKDVMLIVTDGQSEPYAVLKPLELTAAGKGTPLTVTHLLAVERRSSAPGAGRL